MSPFTKILILSLTLIGFLVYSASVVAKPLKSIGSLGDDEIVLVGRIELVPPLEDFEQNLKTIGSKRFKNNAVFLIGADVVDLQNLRLRDNKHADRVELGQDFYLRRKRHSKLFYSGSMIYTKSVMVGHGRRAGVDLDYLILPGILKYNIKESDKAIYIGTIRYHRDDYDAITRVDQLNQFESAKKAFVEKFGNSVKLRRIKAFVIK